MQKKLGKQIQKTRLFGSFLVAKFMGLKIQKNDTQIKLPRINPSFKKKSSIDPGFKIRGLPEYLKK
jgi:hypothetical protein